MSGQPRGRGRCARGEVAPSRGRKRGSVPRMPRSAGRGRGRPADPGAAVCLASAGTGRIAGNAGWERERVFLRVSGRGRERRGRAHRWRSLLAGSSPPAACWQGAPFHPERVRLAEGPFGIAAEMFASSKGQEHRLGWFLQGTLTRSEVTSGARAAANGLE